MKRYLDRKLGTDLRRKIGEFMMLTPFVGAVLLAVGAVIYRFPIPALFVIGFISWYVVAYWLSEN